MKKLKTKIKKFVFLNCRDKFRGSRLEKLCQLAFMLHFLVVLVGVAVITSKESGWTFENPKVAGVVENTNLPKNDSFESHNAVGTDPTLAKSEAEGGKTPSVEAQIKNKFVEEPVVATAVARGESGLDPRSQGWNCYYNRITGGVLTYEQAQKLTNKQRYSTSCEESDRKVAWSVDCGIFQLNVIGTVCPENYFNPVENIEMAYLKYKARHFQPWVAYNNGQYLNHMK